MHISGTTGFDYSTMRISDDVVEQAGQCVRNIGWALGEAGCTFADVVRVRYILPNGDDFEPCWPVLRQHFGETRPAATMFVARLADPRMKIEIEVEARRPDEPKKVAADNALAFAAGSVLGDAVLTVEMKINYVRAVRGGGVVARADVVGAGHDEVWRRQAEDPAQRHRAFDPHREQRAVDGGEAIAGHREDAQLLVVEVDDGEPDLLAFTDEQPEVRTVVERRRRQDARQVDVAAAACD